MPQVSVILNVRNGAATLGEALDSVLCQSFSDWELIVWDDCSTDDSAKIVSRYHDPRIHYFLSPQDTSLGEARNNAIGQASGGWIAFLDQDDLWMPRKLEEQMALAAEDVGLIYGRTIRFYPSGRERDYDHAHEYQLLPEGDIFSLLFSQSCFIAMSSAVFRRSAIEAIAGIPAEIRIIPDYYLYVAVCRKYRARAVQHPVARYRMHAGSMSHTVALPMHQEVLWLIERWSGDLDPATMALCRKRHLTAVALEEMRSPRTFLRGLHRLLTQGSILSQLQRPFVFIFHVLRRSFRRPYWRRDWRASHEGAA